MPEESFQAATKELSEMRGKRFRAHCALDELQTIVFKLAEHQAKPQILSRTLNRVSTILKNMEGGLEEINPRIAALEHHLGQRFLTF